MSAYMSFFIRSYNDELMPIGTFSRSLDIYQMFCDHVTYGEIKPITKKTLAMVNMDIAGSRESLNTAMERQKKKEKILTAIHPVPENVMELVDEILIEKESIKTALEELNAVEAFVYHLEWMIEEMEDREKWHEGIHFIPSDAYVFAGIEVGYDPELPQEYKIGLK